ncbi:hypothetical protein [Rhodoblastus sp.]|jgi:hypothetical protein|uniref:hypothetical protein n=1 Tax=Rhodoblastus sp. TaxID=1962975 RepID=UPI0025E86C99|nr:hypothetical protein [Rhodoblastus sp.]
MSSTCLIIQTFVKNDTFLALWQSLLKCDDIHDVHLIIWHDSHINSRKEAEYEKKAELVRKSVEGAIASDGHLFASAQLISNPTNLGTCPTCRTAIDYAAARFDHVIFTEDDTLFARDAIRWFRAAFALEAFNDPDVWAIAGESVFFDAQEKNLPDGYVELARNYAVEKRLGRAFIKLNFVPSTCFATNATKWKEFGATRGQREGANDVCKRCAAENKFCLFPIVPRVTDTGMLHPDGYSVLLHSRERVQEIKSTYLTSDDLPSDEIKGVLVPFTGSDGEIWRRTALLEGFGVLPPWRPE